MTGASAALRRLFRLPASWVLWAAPLILFAPVWLAGKALFWGTPALQFVPWRWIAGEMISRGELPLWNPWSGMGAPLLANYQSALLYPPNWLLFVLQGLGSLLNDSFAPSGFDLSQGLPAWGQTVLVVMHLAWASWGMVRLVRRLNLNPLAQYVSALSFSLSGYMVARAGFLSINAAAAWMPWSILAAEALVRPLEDERQSAVYLRSSLVFAMLLLAGHAQTAWYVLVLAVVWAVVRSQGSAHRLKEGGVSRGRILMTRARAMVRVSALLGLSVVSGIVLSAAQLLPTAEYLLQSQRAAQVDYQLAMTYSFWPWHFVTLLAPGFFGSPASGDYWGYANYWEDAVYIGLLPVLLATAVILGAIRPAASRSMQYREGIRELVVFLLGIASVSFLLALGDHTPLFPWLYQHVPTFDMFQAPARLSIWAVFALALLAGIGAQHWSRPVGSGLYWLRLGTMGALAVSIGSGIGWILLGDVSPTFIRAAAISGLWGITAGLLGLSAPAGTGAVKPGGRVPFLRRMLQTISPRLVKPDLQETGSSKRTRAIPVWQQRVQAGIHSFLSQFWSAIVLLVITADLIVAGWGLNPGVHLDFYARSSNLPSQVENLGSGGRLFLPSEDERRLKFDEFLRFDTFSPEHDWRSLRDVLLPNLNLMQGIPSANNFDPLVPGRYERWMQSLDSMGADQRTLMLNLMGVGVVENMVNAPQQMVQFSSLSDASAARSAGRMRWLPCARFAVNEDSAWQQVMEAGAGLLDGTIIIEGDEAAEAEPGCPTTGHAPVEVTTLSESAQQLTLQIESQSDGWLLVADTWYPGWRAYLDGAETLLLRGDYLFRAVWVPAGDHRVTLVYTPVSFRSGAGISLVGWLLCFAGLLRSNMGNRHLKQERN